MDEVAELEQALDRRLQQCTEQQQEVGKQPLPYPRPYPRGRVVETGKSRKHVKESK